VKAASSDISSFVQGTSFSPIIDDGSVNPESVKKLILVSGKLYHDLVKDRSSRGLDKDVAIVRLEELCPFPFTVMESLLKRYSQSASITWVQEEAENQGAWPHVMPRLQNLLNTIGSRKDGVRFVGRSASEVPAVGIGKVHSAQTADIFARAFA
jgi:probable 2-oxoglutarate dehydrogenase E1 component DHKTD1